MKRLLVLPLLFLLGIAEVQALPYGLYLDLGSSRFSSAEKKIEDILKNPDEASGSDLSIACYIYSKLKHYGKLAQCTDRLEARIKAGETRHSDFMIMSSPTPPLPDTLRAMAAFELGDPTHALALARKAYAMVTDEGAAGIFSPVSYKIELFQIMSISAVLTGQRDEAEKYLALLEAVDVPYMGGQQWSNLKDVDLAKINLALGRNEKALKYLRKGEHYTFARVVTDALMMGGDSLSTYYDLPKFLMLGKALMETGQLDEAKKALDTVLNHKRAAEYPDVLWVAFEERGRLAEKEGDSSGAIGYYSKAIDIIEQERSSINTEAAKIGFAGDKQSTYGRIIALLFAADRHGEAFDYVERSKSRALVDMLAGKKDFEIAGPDPEKTRQALALLDQADALSRSAGPATESAAEQRNLVLVRQDIRSAAPDLSSLVSVGTVPLAGIQAKLAADEQLVEYYYLGDAMYAFVIDQQGLHAVSLNAKGLGDAVQVFRKSLENVSSDEWVAEAKGLYSRLITPIEPLLTGRRMLIVPHGALHYLPFNALIAENGSQLIDRHSLRTLPSASVISLLKPAVGSKGAPILVFGNPDLGDSRFDLTFAEAEARTVASLAPGSRLLLRKEASQGNFRRAAGLFSRIHFATHGKFQAESPLDSGLYLARDADYDGLLKVSDLYSMQLNADLVTLSACETGLGKIDNGDDVVGLARGFLYAGTRSVVSSLWSVDDKATAELMKAFYENLTRLDKQEALRQAQIAVRTSFPHPYYWAAFELTGRAD
jgi:CHAT domain-containing protein/predicted negative regulator of RcsB-dependent stress response